MIAGYLLLAVPLVGIIFLIIQQQAGKSCRMNTVFNAAAFICSVWLALEVLLQGALLSPGKQLYIDSFNVYLIVLTAFVGLTTSIFSGTYMLHEQEIGRITIKMLRFYNAAYQAFMFSMYLVLTTNNMGMLWVAMEAATLATVLLVSLYRTPEAVEAAWKYFILCGVGIAQALFGTILLYFAAEQVSAISPGDALFWTTLNEHAASLNPGVMNIAFVFLLIGYGTKMGLVPLHNWLPDAHSEGPTPMSAILSGLLLNDALYAVVRCKMLADDSLGDNLSGYLMMGFGLLSFLVAALLIHHQKDIKRLFSYSSIEHMGLMTFAFGIGTPWATFAALFHMTTHSLVKSAIFVTVGHASQLAGTQRMEKIRGLINTQPAIGWGLLLGTIAIAGFPPFGVFASEFLILIATMDNFPWLAPLLLLGVGIAFAGLFKHLQPIVFGPVPEGQQAITANLVPVMIHLALVLWLGLSIPLFLGNWFNQATQLIAGSMPL